MMSILQGFLGGLLIGAAAAITLLGAGEIMGFSGIISPVLKNPIAAAQDPSQQWKLAFLSAFMLSAYAFLFPFYDADIVEEHPSVTSAWAYGISGLLVGFGTKLGNGCTSGHGVCGMARLSRRSIASVFTFMGAAVGTSIITSPHLSTGKHFEFLRRDDIGFMYIPYVMPVITLLIVAAALYGSFTIKDMTSEESRKKIPAFLAGIVASGGLTLSKMVYPEIVHGFLDLSGLARSDWDATLMFVMGGAVIVSFAAYQFVPGHSIISSCPKMEKPSMGTKFGVPTNTTIDGQLLFGALCFGVGWGISGLCPGPALLLTMKGVSGMILIWWPTFYVGMRFGEMIKEYLSTPVPPTSKPTCPECDCEKAERYKVLPEKTQELNTDGNTAEFQKYGSTESSQ
eukprot:scaffold10860_cov182-Amphora_coffeaeformis.AAC.21